MLKNGRCTMLYIYIVTYYDERDNKHAQQQKSSSSCTYATAGAARTTRWPPHTQQCLLAKISRYNTITARNINSYQ